MYLDLTDVLRDPGVIVEKKLDIPAGILDEWELTEPATGFVRASNARRSIVVRGKAKTAVKMECGRCLREYVQPLEFDLDITVPMSHFNAFLGASAVEADENDDGDELTRDDINALFQEHALDVSELVRQAIVLAAPIQPLCSADCAGLPETEVFTDFKSDPRWAALEKLNASRNATQLNAKDAN
ncbi:hypothetical protein B1R32_10342 [Abditibacterium utsteinense]|uniref:DUF177 domain-containing protein n=1 Tax=Abditibacterium utsteinense TaxID=1960156 RepID=A0A2S8SVF5_9BACT|nr:DUF177 domain-containing protein [Abditibacterium utsteinense]PQV64775.1 hypothetical protein B1R32_10342 [Abditibacterium utsteinense]